MLLDAAEAVVGRWHRAASGRGWRFAYGLLAQEKGDGMEWIHEITRVRPERMQESTYLA